MTVRQKLENYWYHYKWHTIVIGMLVLCLAVGVTQCAAKEKYDQTCVLYCNRVVGDDAALALEELLEQAIPDRDGNGTVAFQVYNLSYNARANNVQNATFANAQKLTTVVAAPDYILYVVDAYGYDRLMLKDGMNLFETYDFLPDKDHTAWNWKGSDLQKSMADYKLPENLYFCIRKVKNTTIDDNEQAWEDARQAAELIQMLMEP